MPPVAAELRALYRRFLRELPARQPSMLANPSPVQRHIRSDLETAPRSDSSAGDHQSSSLQKQSRRSESARLEEAEQYLQYIKSQRMYATLIERYNPGMNMDEEDRVRLTARRVGMNLPIEVLKGNQTK